MIHIVIAPECKKLTIFICCKLDIHKCRGSLSCISNILELIKYQRHRTFKDLNSSADQSLICIYPIIDAAVRILTEMNTLQGIGMK